MDRIKMDFGAPMNHHRHKCAC